MAKQDEMYNGVMGAVYNKINEFLGAGDMLFTMEFPGRPLNRHKFEYSTDDRNSVLTKPYTIAEAEFRLSDDLYNLSPITQGPNGKKLTTVFDTLLNNYVPKLSDLKDFVVDKSKIKDWLLTKIEDEIDGKKMNCSRMEFCQLLYNKYLNEKVKWEKEKNDVFDRYKGSGDLDGFSKWVSSEGMVRDEQLNNLFNDAVVRGNYHEVLTYLGFLNISSTAEQLEKTKQNMRNSVRKSLDASMLVYPVQFQPNNWFKALTPNFSPKDLTMSKDILVLQFNAKQKELGTLETQLANLQLKSSSPEEIEALKAKVEDQRAAFKKAESNLIKQYGEGALTAFKVYLNAQTGGALSAVRKISAANFDKTTADALGLGQEVVDSMLKTYQANADFLDSAQQLSEVQSYYAESQAHDYRAEINRLQERIKELKADISYIGGLVSGTYNKENQVDPATDMPVIPQEVKEGNSDLSFTDIIIKTSDAEDYNKSTSESSASNSSWKVSGWFFSAGGQSSQSSAMSENESYAMSKSFEIGMRVTKVTIDRGGWFNPTIFDMSHAFHRLADLRAGMGITKDDVKNKTAKDLQSLIQYNDETGVKKSHLLPSYPVAFVIAKDITIKISMSEQESHTMKSNMEKSSSSGGGFLCFSCSNSSSSKSSNETAFHGYHNNAYYVRIPGPQILGWFQNFTPKDNATKYEALTDDQLKLELEKELNKGITPGNVNVG